MGTSKHTNKGHINTNLHPLAIFRLSLFPIPSFQLLVKLIKIANSYNHFFFNPRLLQYHGIYELLADFLLTFNLIVWSERPAVGWNSPQLRKYANRKNCWLMVAHNTLYVGRQSLEQTKKWKPSRLPKVNWNIEAGRRRKESIKRKWDWVGIDAVFFFFSNLKSLARPREN